MRKTVRLLVAVLGAVALVGLLAGVHEILKSFDIINLSEVLLPGILIMGVAAVFAVGAVIFYLLFPSMMQKFERWLNKAEETITEIPTRDMLPGLVGLIVGLLIALLLSTLINLIPNQWVAIALSLFVYVTCAVLGVRVSLKRFREIAELEGVADDETDERSFGRRRLGRQGKSIPPKVLDTSVIIDGRILDIVKTGVLEGKLLVPEFVLQELRHIADSADALRRQRGRRGLDILSAMQSENQQVQVVDRDYEGLEVDEKLMRLAKDVKGKVVTNDFNLNKVAKVKGVEVININQLASALRTAVLPGEEMFIAIIREGKEQGQGVGYLDDGTMLVVDGGRKHVGETIPITVTSVLQTSAGRMVFAKAEE